jgi:hypothetical protein
MKEAEGENHLGYRRVGTESYIGEYGDQMRELQEALGPLFFVFVLLQEGEYQSQFTPCDFDIGLPHGVMGGYTFCAKNLVWCPGGAQHALPSFTLGPNRDWFDVPLMPDAKAKNGVLLYPGYAGSDWAERMASDIQEATRRTVWWDLNKNEGARAYLSWEKSEAQWVAVLEKIGQPSAEWRIEHSPAIEALALIKQLGA